MKPLRIAASIAGIALMAPAAAGAADLTPEVIPHVPAVEPVPIEVGSGWYLRGDLGYAFTDSPAVEYDLYANGAGTDVWFANESLSDMMMIGGGFGYKFNAFFRADATIDYKFLGDFYGNTGGGCGNPCVDTANLSILSLMANAYIDLGSYYGFTPYVGGGLGAAYVSWDNYTSTTPGVTYSGESDWAFTAAVMAGLSYDITPNIAIDAGYRYQWIGGGDVVTDGGFGIATYDDLNIHEARVGLRYTIGGGQLFTPEPAPIGPIVTKY